MNNVSLVGRLVRPIELHYTQEIQWLVKQAFSQIEAEENLK